MQRLQTNYKTKYNAAIYCRLSRDDGADALSQSIVSQKETLTQYALEQGFNIKDVYIDDGYSGTTFDRPAFNRLISDIENKEVNCVITKDLSRLGRNYLKTGYYTEEFFPAHNVRYIALNDAYDSLEDDNDFTPFKNIINEWYAKDISKKIKSSFKHRQHEGTLIINSPYGYRNDKEKGRVIDSAASQVVEYIFSEYVNNKTIPEICEVLQKKKVIAPKAYKYYYESGDGSLPEGYSFERATTWTRTMIYEILNEYQYTGALICNKSHNLSFKNKKKIHHDESEWMIHENKFEPIITKDMFSLASLKLKNAAKAKLPLTINKYNGILYCKDCGRKATFLRNDKFITGLYKCRVKGCRGKAIGINEIDEIIKNEILSFKGIVLQHEEEVLALIDKNPKPNGSKSKANLLLKLEEVKEASEKALADAFEAKCSGEIMESVYKKVVESCELKLRDLNARIDMLEDNKESKEYDIEGAKRFIRNIKGFNKYSKITRGAIETIIQRIEYYEDSEGVITFDIYYKGIDWLVKDFDVIRK